MLQGPWYQRWGFFLRCQISWPLPLSGGRCGLHGGTRAGLGAGARRGIAAVPTCFGVTWEVAEPLSDLTVSGT